MRTRLAARAMLAMLLAVWWAPAARAAELAVVASIKPVHAMAAAVMAGVGEPSLLVEGNRSPHTYSMRPSDARDLQAADLVFWIGPSLEAFLAPALANRRPDTAVVALGELPGLVQLPSRPAGLLRPDPAAPAGATEPAAHDHAPIDQHLWLDPANGATMIAAIAQQLGAADPEHAAHYAANAAKARADLAALEARLAAQLQPISGRPYVVFHDAYHYFEARFRLQPLAAITVSPEVAPGARRLQAIRRQLLALRAVCVFAEPQFEPALLTTLTEGTTARTAVLDPEGAMLEPGPALYPQLLQGLSDGLTSCLGDHAAAPANG